MIKKLLFTLILGISTVGFCQKKSITKLAAAPNPFTTATKITFTAKEKTAATFTVKNILGKLVYTEQLTTLKGLNTITFLNRNLLPGIYIYTIKDKNSIVSKRFIVK